DEEPEIVDVPLHLHYQSAVLNVKGPVLGRLYMLKHSKIKHLIEPKITLQYVTKVDAQDRDRLIAVDRTDYPAHSTAKFSLTNRLLHKKKNGKKSAKDILSHTISQTFYLEPALASWGRTINGLYPQYSQLTNLLRFKPVRNFDMRARADYNHYLAKLTRVTFSLKYTDKKSPVIGSFNYTKQINQYQEPDYEHNKETIGGGLEINHPDIPFKLKSGLQYDIKNQIVMDGSLIISVDYQCIIFKGEAKLIRRNDVTETQFTIGVSIGNLGMVKDLLGTSDD
ncbi:MAG: LPS-assembly protein LptD, partial [bacterium]|nr:LPS-assembly protein LptD [bacterium]